MRDLDGDAHGESPGWTTGRRTRELATSIKAIIRDVANTGGNVSRASALRALARSAASTRSCACAEAPISGSGTGLGGRRAGRRTRPPRPPQAPEPAGDESDRAGDENSEHRPIAAGRIQNHRTEETQRKSHRPDEHARSDRGHVRLTNTTAPEEAITTARLGWSFTEGAGSSYPCRTRSTSAHRSPCTGSA